MRTFAMNQRWSYTFDNIGFDLDDSGWEAAYGGNLTITSEDSHSGNFCLKMTGRTQAWHSPALNIDRILNEGGAGRYSITAWIKVVNINTYLREIARTLIRATELNSFIEQYDNNFYYPIKCVSLPESEWICIQGYVSVTPQDIYQGNFKFMLDVIDPMENQILYLDDVTFFKLSDDPNPNNVGTNVINDKHFVWEEYLDGAYAYYNDPSQIDQAVSFYYDLLQRSDYTKHSETVFTFTSSDATNLALDIAPDVLGELSQAEYNSYISNANSAFSTLIGFFPQVSNVSTAMDFASFLDDALSSTDSFDYSRFYTEFSSMVMSPSTTQSNVTYSLYLLRHKEGNIAFSHAFQYKVVCSDGRSFCHVIDEDFYNALFRFSSIYVDGSTHNKPSIYKVTSAHLYISEL